MKIFVSIVSYRDPLLKNTVVSLLENKSGRHDITIGIFEQTAKENSLLSITDFDFNNIKYKRIDPEYSEGVCWARHINGLQVEDEELFYQVDSHMLFEKNCDRNMVNDWKRGRDINGHDRIIITANCKGFELDEVGNPVILPEPNITCKVKYFYYEKTNDILAAHGDHIPSTENIEPAIHICAGNFFTTTKWVKEVGADPGVFFEGEEQLMVLQSFIKGYKLYHPRSIHCYHYNKTHEYITKQWFKPIVKDEIYHARLNRGYKYVREFISEMDEDILEKFYEYSGVDYINQIIDERSRTNSIVVSKDI